MHRAVGRIGCLALAAVSLAACGASDRKGGAGSADSTSTTSGRTAGESTDGAAASSELATAWTDGAILAFSNVANSGEAEIGRIGQQKATAAAVKATGADLVADHTTALNDMQAAAAKSQLAPDMKNADVQLLVQHLNDELRAFSTQKSGTAWDRTYIDREVADQQDILGKLQDAAKHTSNADLRGALDKTAARIQEHLAKARGIKTTTRKS